MGTKHPALAGSFLVWGPWGLAEMPVKPCTSRQGLGSTQPSAFIGEEEFLGGEKQRPWDR